MKVFVSKKKLQMVLDNNSVEREAALSLAIFVKFRKSSELVISLIQL